MNNSFVLTALLLAVSSGSLVAQRADYETGMARRPTVLQAPIDVSARADYGPGGYNQPGYGNGQYGGGPGRGNGNRRGYDNDRQQDLFKVQHLDRIVNLSGRQKRDVLDIENYYDRELAQGSRYGNVSQRILWQKSQDVLSILSPRQRDRLFAYEQYRAYNRGGYGSGYDNSSRGWTPPAGRRW